MMRPPGTRYNERFTQQTMKHPPSVMIWGVISTQGTAGLFFLNLGTTINGKKTSGIDEREVGVIHGSA